MSLLHLDAVCEVSNILHDCGWKVGRKDDWRAGLHTEHHEKAGFVKTDLMARAEMVVQLPFLLLQTVACQTLRGTACLLSGMFVGDQARIKFGIIDIISVLAQIILLPVIALVGLLNPKWAGDLTSQLCDPNGNEDFVEDPNEIKIRYQKESDMEYDPRTRNIIASAIMGIVELPVGLVDALLKTVSYTLTGGIFLDERKRARISSIALGAIMTLPKILEKENAIEHRGFDCSFTVNYSSFTLSY